MPIDREQAFQQIRAALHPAEIERIVVEFDKDLREEIAKVIVREDQLDLALQNYGLAARQAAMQSGMSVEVVLDSERNRGDAT